MRVQFTFPLSANEAMLFGVLEQYMTVEEVQRTDDKVVVVCQTGLRVFVTVNFVLRRMFGGTARVTHMSLEEMEAVHNGFHGFQTGADGSSTHDVPLHVPVRCSSPAELAALPDDINLGSLQDVPDDLPSLPPGLQYAKLPDSIYKVLSADGDRAMGCIREYMAHAGQGSPPPPSSDAIRLEVLPDGVKDLVSAVMDHLIQYNSISNLESMAGFAATLSELRALCLGAGDDSHASNIAHQGASVTPLDRTASASVGIINNCSHASLPAKDNKLEHQMGEKVRSDTSQETQVGSSCYSADNVVTQQPDENDGELGLQSGVDGTGVDSTAAVNGHHGDGEEQVARPIQQDADDVPNSGGEGNDMELIAMLMSSLCPPSRDTTRQPSTIDTTAHETASSNVSRDPHGPLLQAGRTQPAVSHDPHGLQPDAATPLSVSCRHVAPTTVLGDSHALPSCATAPPATLPEQSHEALCDAVPPVSSTANLAVDDLHCPIMAELVTDPVIAMDGFTYERAAISAWYRNHDTSPMTNEPVASKLLLPNRVVKSLVQQLIASTTGVPT